MSAQSFELHQITESIFKNLIEVYHPSMKQLMVAGKAYFRSMSGVNAAAKAYFEALGYVAKAAKELPMGAQDIGGALFDLAHLCHQIQTQQEQLMKLFYNQILTVFESRVEQDIKTIQGLHKQYSAGHKIRRMSCEKMEGILKKQSKKSRNSIKYDSKLEQVQRDYSISQKKLIEYRQASAKQAFLISRSRYCHLLQRHFDWMGEQRKGFAKANEALGLHVPEWEMVCKSPDHLPEPVQKLMTLPMPDGLFYNHSNNNNSAVADQQMTAPSMGRMSTYMPNGRRPSLHGSLDRMTIARSNGERVMELPLQPSHDPPPMKTSGEVQAHFSHRAPDENQLSFDAGDIITMVGEGRNGWHYGCNQRTQEFGWFPLSYTRSFASPGQNGTQWQRAKSMANVSMGEENGGPPQLEPRSAPQVRKSRDRPHSMHDGALLSQKDEDQQNESMSGISSSSSSVPPAPPPVPPVHVLNGTLSRAQTVRSSHSSGSNDRPNGTVGRFDSLMEEMRMMNHRQSGNAGGRETPSFSYRESSGESVNRNGDAYSDSDKASQRSNPFTNVPLKRPPFVNDRSAPRVTS